MGIGPITLKLAGAVTDLGGINYIRSPVLTTDMLDPTFADYTLPSFVHLPELRGCMFADGIKPVRLVVEETALRAGDLAPGGAQGTMTATPTGARASVTYDTGGNQPATDVGQMWLYSLIDWVSVLGAPTPNVQMLVGATAAESFNNLVGWLEGTGVDGTGYVDSTSGDTALMLANIRVTAKTATAVSVESIDYGTAGNSFLAFLLSAPVGSPWIAGTTLGTSNSGNVGIVGFFSGGLAGTQADPPGPGPGRMTYAYTHYRRIDGAETGRSGYVEVNLGETMDVTLANMLQAWESSFTFNRWYRTAVGGGLLRLGETIPAATGAVDSFSDTQLSGPGEVRYVEQRHRLYEQGHIPRVRWIARHRGRVFGGGADLWADYTEGTVNILDGAFKATLSATAAVTFDWEGRDIQMQDSAVWYRIVMVEPGTNIVHLNLPFVKPAAAASDTYTYVLSDAHARNPSELFWSEPLLPNLWPPKNSILAVTTPSPEGITGMVEHMDALIVFTETGIWEVTPSAVTEFQARNRYEGVGCIAGHSILSVEGSVLFAAADGIYSWQASQAAPQKISNPPANQDGSVSGIQQTYNRISQAHRNRIVGNYDPEERIVRWYAPLDGDPTNRFAFVLDLQTFSWQLDTAEDITMISAVADSAGQQQTLAGNQYGQIFQIDVGNVDNVFGTEPVRTLTASGTSVFTVAGAGWTPGQLMGSPVWFVSPTGDFTRETIISNDADTFTLVRAIPDPGLVQIVLGGILLDMESGKWDLGDHGRRRTFARIRIDHSVDVDGQYFVASAADNEDPTVRTIASALLTVQDGETLFRAQRVGRSHSHRILCIEPGCDPEFVGYEIEMIMRDRPDA